MEYYYLIYAGKIKPQSQSSGILKGEHDHVGGDGTIIIFVLQKIALIHLSEFTLKSNLTEDRNSTEIRVEVSVGEASFLAFIAFFN